MMRVKMKVRKKLCPLLPQRHRTDPTTAIFAPAADTTSSAAARIADRQQYFLAILELIQQALRQIGLFGARRRREERAGHHLA